MKTKVELHFEGVVEVEIDGDPEDEDWDDKLAKAWAAVPAQDISENASLVQDVAVPAGEYCEACGEVPSHVADSHEPGCPDDGRVMCYWHHQCSIKEEK